MVDRAEGAHAARDRGLGIAIRRLPILPRPGQRGNSDTLLAVLLLSEAARLLRAAGLPQQQAQCDELGRAVTQRLLTW